MRILKTLLVFGAVCTLALTTGCASVQKASPAEDIAAKTFKSNPDYSRVYIYRNEALGAALSMPVTVDGKLAGNTGPKSFFKFDLPAGKHVFTSQGKKSTLNLTTENGKIYYIWQEVKMGAMSGGSELQVVDQNVGQKGVKQCVLIKSNF
ncbi:MAG TPA: DUF2846 domain-containing protein [Cellvibrio sp.]